VRFHKRGFRLAEMKNTEIHRRRVEEAAPQRQPFGVALAKLDAGMKLLRVRDHSGGKIDAEHRRASFRCGSRDIARTAGNVKKSHAALEPRGSQQRTDCLASQIAKRSMVFIGNSFPTGMLEVAEFLRVKNHKGPCLRRTTLSSKEFFFNGAGVSIMRDDACSLTPRLNFFSVGHAEVKNES
jgi:hypothetical protein